jgi:hypothetical protein
VSAARKYLVHVRLHRDRSRGDTCQKPVCPHSSWVVTHGLGAGGLTIQSTSGSWQVLRDGSVVLPLCDGLNSFCRSPGYLREAHQLGDRAKSRLCVRRILSVSKEVVSLGYSGGRSESQRPRRFRRRPVCTVGRPGQRKDPNDGEAALPEFWNCPQLCVRDPRVSSPALCHPVGPVRAVVHLSPLAPPVPDQMGTAAISLRRLKSTTSVSSLKR